MYIYLYIIYIYIHTCTNHKLASQIIFTNQNMLFFRQITMVPKPELRSFFFGITKPLFPVISALVAIICPRVLMKSSLKKTNPQFSSWWFQPHLKNIRQNGNLAQGENRTYLSCHHLEILN